MKIFSEPIQKGIEDYAEVILIYCIVITIALLFFVFKRLRIRARYRTFKKMRISIAKIDFSFERNEDEMFKELWEENERKTEEIRELERQIKAFRTQGIVIGIALLLFALLMFHYKSGWMLIFSILVKVTAISLLLGLISLVIK